MKDELSISVVGPDKGILSPPESAFRAIDEDSAQAGGEWELPQKYEGSIGRTMFDTPSSKDGTITVLLPKENIDTLPNQALVRIESAPDDRTYLGAVTEGPFAEPDGLRADATPMVISTVQGGLLMPKYHGRVQVEVIGERLQGGAIIPPRRRPKPNSPVFVLDANETGSVLRLDGDMRIGLAEGFDDLSVNVQSTSKNVFPRHLGILGTTGGGKSTTVSGLLSKAQEQRMAVIIIDTEGEYCAMNEPTEDPVMIQSLNRLGMKARGVSNTRIYHLVGRETRNPKHPNLTPFSLRFSEPSPYAIQEILDLNDAQSERFFKAYEITKLAMERLGIWPRTADDKKRLFELDELDSGYPEMKVDHLYDIVAQIAAMKNNDPDPYLQTPTFSANRDQLKGIINQAQTQSNVPSWRKVQGKLGQVKRLKIFDSAQARPLDYTSMVRPGAVSIIDLSDTDSPYVRNLVIAELLRSIQIVQDANYLDAIQEGRQPTATSIFIEEAHEFLSVQRIKQMEVLFQQVARIARRGRKRWLGLVFISQMPQHLPDEVLSLINNWILHKITDVNVVNRLKRSIGGINESLWRQLPSLAPGQAIASFATHARPILVGVDPTPCKLLMVE
jgi:uncharacterized protein